MRLLIFTTLGILSFYFSAAALANCDNPAGSAGQIIYNESHSIFQGCTQNSGWVAFHGHTGATPPPSGPTNCDNIGETCSDDTIYAGPSPDGNVPMYTTPADAPNLMSWNNGQPNYTTTGYGNPTDGDGNTEGLAALSDAGHPYEAATYCEGLSAHGHTDWYLPAAQELDVLFTNSDKEDLDGTFDTSDTISSWYWSSSEATGNALSHARYRIFRNGGQGETNKDYELSIRCVRK